MPAPLTSDELKNELHATLAARREVGAGYDDQFVASFMEKLKEHVLLERRADMPPARPAVRSELVLSPEHRLQIALVSLLLLFVLMVIVMAGIFDSLGSGFTYFAIGLAIVLANIALYRRRGPQA